MLNKIKLAANKYKKATHGETTLEHTIEYAQALNYTVLFFNSPSDKYLVRYNLQDTAKTTSAFTYSELAHIIFIENSLGYSEKLRLLLHEVGHIALNHIDSIYLKNTDEIEAEAEAFVCATLYNKHFSVSRTAAAMLVIFSLFFGVLCGYLLRGALTSNFSNADTSNETAAVYVTQSGTKYHRSNCRYILNSKSTALTKANAKKLYTPCLVCNP